MLTSQIFEGALKKLRRDGWTQRHGGRDGVKTCLWWALRDTRGIDEPLDSVSGCLPILTALCDTDTASDWNDAPERTWPDVEALLTAAITIAEQQEQEATKSECVAVAG